MKPMQPSEFLAKIVGAEPLPRSEVTKQLLGLYQGEQTADLSNKREILAAATLESILGEKKNGHVSDDQGCQ